MANAKQIKMARAALNWTVADLARESAVSVRTINRLEANEDAAITPANLKLIISTLEAAGVEFIGTPEEGPGVRLWK